MHHENQSARGYNSSYEYAGRRAIIFRNNVSSSVYQISSGVSITISTIMIAPKRPPSDLYYSTVIYTCCNYY
jgi:hypothetical protein